MNRHVLSAVTALAFFAGSLSATASECGSKGKPSLKGGAQTEILFHNDTGYATRVYWADFRGRLIEYALVQPNDVKTYKTYMGHHWYFEVITPEEEVKRRQGEGCFGPITTAYSDSACTVRVLYEDGVGVNAGGCDYE